MHLPNSVAEERDLAGVAVPALSGGDRWLRQHPDRELDRATGRVPALRSADLGAISRWWKLLTGLLFLGAYLVDVIAAPRGAWGQIPTSGLWAAAYHSLFLALLVAAALIDL